MRFDVLGPLVITGPAGPVSLPGGHGRTMAAWLVLNANHQVGWRATLEVLWPDGPPSTGPAQARTLARNLASQLGGETLAVGDKIVLNAADDALDSWRFARLFRLAEAHLEDGDRARARANIESALELWRGDPYPELGRALAAIEVIDHLTDLRLDAVEALHGIELTGAVGPRLVADLSAEVIRHPHRPRLWRQLALALYRSSRQSDALAALARARAQLGPRDAPAARLESAILCHDPILERGEPDQV